MNSFGLGLVLNFVDNASSGMNAATANFNRMSATADSMSSSVNASATEMAAIAYSFSAVGDTFTSIGSSIMNVFAGISQRVIDTGGQMLNYRMQLSALYGSVEAGEAKMEEIKDYAMSSVFEISSLIPAVTMMKAVGVEAMQEITTSSGSATQKLLDYASDLAAMMPNMRNVYGTGVQAAMGAFKEYIAEGNAISLKRGAGLDIESILGEDIGGSIAERTQQVADLIDKLNIVGYTANLAGTPTQRLSNMQDALFNSLSKIADSGVFEVYCGLLETLSDWVFSLVENEETFNAITGVLAETISALLSPLQSMLDWVVQNSDAIITWIKENPKLVKNILLTVAAVGAFLIVGGSLLKMLSSIAFAMSGLNVLKSLPMLLGKVVIATLPFVAVAGLAYTAWSTNLGGIQDKITWFVNNIGDIFTILGDAWGDGFLSEERFQKAKDLGILPFISGILQLKYYWDFFVEGFKKGFTSFFEGLVNALGALGIDISGLGEKLMDFLKRLTQPGAEEEWTKLGETVGALVAGLATLALAVKILTPVFKLINGIIKGIKAIVNVFKTIKTFFGWFKGLNLATKLGNFFARVAPFFSKIGVFFTKLGTMFVKLGGLLSKLFSWLAPVGKAIATLFSAIGSAISTALTAIASALGISVGWVIAIIVAIIAAVVLIIVFWDEIAAFFVWLGKVIADFFVNLWNVTTEWLAKAFTAVWDFISKIAQAIWNSPFVKLVRNIIGAIVDIIVGIAKVVWSVIKMIGTIIAGIAKVIWAIVSGVVKVIWSIIKGVAKFIWTVVQGIWNIIKKVVELVWTIIKTAAMLIWKIIQTVYQFFRMIFLAILAVVKLVITGIVNFFKWLWNLIKPIVQAIGDFFKRIFDWIKNKIIMPVVNWIVGAFNWVKEKVLAVVAAVGNFFNKIFTWISDNIITPFREFIGGVFDWISDKVDKVTSWIKDAFDVAAGWITNVFQGVADFFTGIWDGITAGAKAMFDWIADALGWIIDAISGIGDFFGGIIDGVGGFFQGVGDGLANFVGLDTGGYVKTTGIAVLHPNEVVVNDDTTRRLQNFLGKYENDTVNGLVKPNAPQAILNNIYPTLMESVPVTTVPAESVSNIDNSSYVNSTQNFVQSRPVEVVERTGDTRNDYSVTFAAGSVVIQLNSASDAELEKAAEKLMKIIARKQQLKAMAVRG